MFCDIFHSWCWISQLHTNISTMHFSFHKKKCIKFFCQLFIFVVSVFVFPCKSCVQKNDDDDDEKRVCEKHFQFRFFLLLKQKSKKLIWWMWWREGWWWCGKSKHIFHALWEIIVRDKRVRLLRDDTTVSIFFALCEYLKATFDCDKLKSTLFWLIFSITVDMPTTS